MTTARRPYDDQMPEVVRLAAVARRQDPDGVCHTLRVSTRGPRLEEHYEYPWGRMKLGDYFFVPLRGRRTDSLAVRYRQIAARRDWELAIVKVEHLGEPHLRVCLTVLDVSNYRKKKSDGQWLEQRKVRYRRSKTIQKLKEVKPLPDEYEINWSTKTFTPNKKSEPVGVDATLSPDYDRDQIVKQRLAALGIGR